MGVGSRCSLPHLSPAPAWAGRETAKTAKTKTKKPPERCSGGFGWRLSYRPDVSRPRLAVVRGRAGRHTSGARRVGAGAGVGRPRLAVRLSGAGVTRPRRAVA
ncbi:hypothetical protein GCM10018952_45020 [Streptosporangium vulgare]